MLQLLQSKSVAVVVGALTYGLTTWACLQPQKQFEQAVHTLQAKQESDTAEVTGPSWSYKNPELSQMVSELKEEREAVATRARQLDELEARLNAERQEIYSVTQTVQRLRMELDKVVTRVTEEEAANLKKLGRMYAAMSPEGAARILKEMTDDQIVKLLALMKNDESAPILESLGAGGKEEAKRAVLISNRLQLAVTPPKKPAP